MTFRSILELDARLSDRLRVAEKPGLLRALAVFFARVSGVDGKPPALVGLRFPKFRLGTNRRK